MLQLYYNAPYDRVKNVVKGENKYSEEWTGCGHSTHSEIDNMNRVPFNKYTRNKYWKYNTRRGRKNRKHRKKIKMDILVIRVSKAGQLKMSKPCYHCTMKMFNCPFARIRYVYYSTNEGTLFKIKLSDLIKTEPHISSGYRHLLGID